MVDPALILHQVDDKNFDLNRVIFTVTIMLTYIVTYVLLFTFKHSVKPKLRFYYSKSIRKVSFCEVLIKC